ncbi:hypothetical protein [Nocardia terpenica]|uniref:Uncharacterized protein n=1 Tax=Nocardia terpenica TaxID=455432 RepID=A0A164LB35_9NOCA|nr:hypothetical protein [Nocardia terpenica]KZM72210.1 hypothetical protein AWN90_36650 [Nocardia terpenica]NQE86646.1 hypothetical protein [Nocardia terpenica]
MAKLISWVAAYDEHGAARWFGPADEVPEWAARQITNPAAWDTVPAPAVEAGAGDGATSGESEPEAEPVAPKRRTRKPAEGA